MQNEIFIAKGEDNLTMEQMLELLKGKKGVVQLKNDLKELATETRIYYENEIAEPELELYKQYNIGKYLIDVYVETVIYDGDIVILVYIYDIE